MPLSDLHTIPPDETDRHVESPDCPCGPRKLPARGRFMWAHQREGQPRGEPTGIVFQKPQPDPMEEALVDWMRNAELRKDGQVTHTGINLVGRQEYAQKYARLIADHIKAHGDDLGKLTDHLSGTTGAGAHVRVWQFAGHVAEGAIEHLRRQGLL